MSNVDTLSTNVELRTKLKLVSNQLESINLYCRNLETYHKSVKEELTRQLKAEKEKNSL